MHRWGGSHLTPMPLINKSYLCVLKTGSVANSYLVEKVTKRRYIPRVKQTILHVHRRKRIPHCGQLTRHADHRSRQLCFIYTSRWWKMPCLSVARLSLTPMTIRLLGVQNRIDLTRPDGGAGEGEVLEAAVDGEGGVGVAVLVGAGELHGRSGGAAAAAGDLDLGARDVVLRLVDVRSVDACCRCQSEFYCGLK